LISQGRVTGRRMSAPARARRGRRPRDLTQPAPLARVLVIGEQQLLTEALGAALNLGQGVQIVGVSFDAGLGATLVRQTRPDVLLLQQTQASASAGDLTRALLEEFPELKVLVLTSVYKESAVFACIEAGAMGYLTMDRGLDELVRSIRQMQAGAVLFAPELLVDLLIRSRRGQQTGERVSTLATARPRELAVLQAFAGGASTHAVAAQLGISVHTVRTHMRNAMAKFETHSKLEAVVFAVKQGLIELHTG